jgi:hypothetical protein
MQLNFTFAKELRAPKDSLGNVLQSQGHENKSIRLRLLR